MLASMSDALRIVLTGFGPFPGVAENATARLVPAVARSARSLFPGCEFVAEVLPTEWRAAPERLTGLYATEPADLVLHFGVAEPAAGFRLERTARNERASRRDAAGELPQTACVMDECATSLTSTFPAEKIAARLESLGLPCSLSDDAGSYLCNAVLFHSLAAAQGQTEAGLTGFVHIPAGLVGDGPDDGAGGSAHQPGCALDWRMAMTGSLEIIAVCLDHIAESRAENPRR
jgi:pyroglutamyl-peptidase